MTSGVAAFMVAIGGTSLFCYLLMSRMQSRRPRHDSTGGDTSAGASSDSSGGDGWSPLTWLRSDTSSSHDSSSSSEGSGGDSGVEGMAAVGSD